MTDAATLLRWCLLVCLFVVGCMLGLWAYLQVVMWPYMYFSIAAVPQEPVAVVLGASVTGQRMLSPIFQERVDEALALYRGGKVSKILVSGDNATLSHDEVDPVAAYLIAHGVPTENIFLDHAGFDTYSSMYRARAIFGVTSIIVVSQAFHLPRALFIAHALGIQAVGMSAGQGIQYFFNYVREIPASVKAAFDIMTNRVPEYLGPQIPISGSGISTQPQ